MALLAGFGFVLGLAAGSFVNVCIRRWPIGMSVISPGSHCPDCGILIAWRDKIPVLSFFLLGRRCRYCSRPISWRYPSVELLNGAVWAVLAARDGGGPEFWKHAIFASMMIVLLFTDLDRRILPDPVTLGGLGLGLAFSLVVMLPAGPVGLAVASDSVRWGPRAASLAESLLAAAVFGGLLWIVGEAYYRIRRVEGLGLGDVKLIAMVGAFHGTAFGALVLVAGTLAAAACGAFYILLAGKPWDHPIPLGSYFAGTALVALFAADAVLNLYWGLILG